MVFPALALQIKKLLEETEKLSAEVLSFRSQNAQLQLQMEVGIGVPCKTMTAPALGAAVGGATKVQAQLICAGRGCPARCYRSCWELPCCICCAASALNSCMGKQMR